MKTFLLFFLIVFSKHSFAETTKTKFTFTFSPGTKIQILNEEKVIKEFIIGDHSQVIETPHLNANLRYSYQLKIFPPQGEPVSHTLTFGGGEQKLISLTPQGKVDVQNHSVNRALIRLFVPNRRAIVIINGAKMEDQEGEIREFTSPPLGADESRIYRIRLDYTDDATNRKIERDLTISVRAGDHMTLKLSNFIPELQ
jgi:uncharacterized protein (TIGR03000 family)